MQETSAIIHSIPVDPLTGSIAVPIYQTSTFVQDAPGVHKGYDYARTNNPTRNILEDILANLEGGKRASAFASGLAAIDAVLKLLQTGDQIIAVDDIYGGAFRQFTHIYQKFGITIHYVDTSDVSAILEKVNDKTRLIWIESPTNPTLKISDLKAIGELSRSLGLLFCVDNTFASPILQKPFEFGADIVLHSATKYLGGHSDLIAGTVITNDDILGDRIKFIQNACGTILSPWDSWLLIRGIETLPLRVQKHCENAILVAKYLQSCDWIDNLYYPGLESHPNHKVAKSQMKGFGGIISFDIKSDDKLLALKFIENLKLFELAESLGGVKSLCCLPSEMTHKSIPRERRVAAGVTDSLIRLSVGLEDAGDLIGDLERAYQQVIKQPNKVLES